MAKTWATADDKCWEQLLDVQGAMDCLVTYYLRTGTCGEYSERFRTKAERLFADWEEVLANTLKYTENECPSNHQEL